MLTSRSVVGKHTHSIQSHLQLLPSKSAQGLDICVAFFVNVCDALCAVALSALLRRHRPAGLGKPFSGCMTLPVRCGLVAIYSIAILVIICHCNAGMYIYEERLSLSVCVCVLFDQFGMSLAGLRKNSAINRHNLLGTCKRCYVDYRM